MSLTIGIDIVQLSRLKKITKDIQLKKILTVNEMNTYKTLPANKALSYLGGRFAAKEAVIKCLANYECPFLTDLEIEADMDGRPQINYKKYVISLSISHEKEYVVSVAILQNEAQ